MRAIDFIYSPSKSKSESGEGDIYIYISRSFSVSPLDNDRVRRSGGVEWEETKRNGEPIAIRPEGEGRGKKNEWVGRSGQKLDGLDNEAFYLLTLYLRSRQGNANSTPTFAYVSRYASRDQQRPAE